MGRFIGRVATTPISMANGRRWFRLLEDFGFDSHEIRKTITVPKGFLTDMASVPLPLQVIVQKDEGLLEAAVLHDYLYATGCDPLVTRKQADRIFLEAMTTAGMGPIKRGWVYHAIRWGGAKSFKARPVTV